MKIKSILAAFAAVALMASCTNEAPVDNGNNNGGGGSEATYATFKFNLNGTKAIGDFDPANPAENDLKDNDLHISDLRLVIFNYTTGAVEHNELLQGTSQTVLLTAGKKRIFVFANTGKLADNGGAAGDDFATRIATFTVAGPKTYADFLTLAFSAGTPQIVSVDKTGARTFKLDNLYTHANATAADGAGSLGLPASNTNQIEYDLTANVTQGQAEDAGVTASDNGTSTNNRFNIQLYYMIAKARLAMGAGVLSDGAAGTKPIVSDVKYTIKNLAKKSYYTQHVVAGVPQSYYHSMFITTTPQIPQVNFDPEFDYASNVKVAATETPGNYLYVPENTSSFMLRGQSSYYAINVNYEPHQVVKKVTHDMNSGLVTEVGTLGSIGALSGEGAKDYLYTTVAIEGIAPGTAFKTLNLLKKAAWIKKHGSAINMWVEPSGSAPQLAEADAIMVAAKAANGGDDPYYTFIGASSWYRLDIGEGAGQQTKFGALRGNKYTATVTKITGPGLPKEGDLTEKPWEPVLAVTYINATIKAAEWKPVTQTGELQ